MADIQPIDQQAVQQFKPKICNFKVSRPEEAAVWDRYVKTVKDMGLDVCHVTISLVKGFLAGLEGSKAAQEINTGSQVIQIQMTNHFNYVVQKPRRQPIELSFVKEEFRGTVRSAFAEAYVLEKARSLQRPFCFRDFLELKYDSFRRIVSRLMRKGKIVRFPAKTCPQFYALSEWINNDLAQQSKTLVLP